MDIGRITVLFMCITVLSCCKKDKETYSYLDTKVMSNFDIKSGSYWVYDNTTNSDVDSFVIESVEKDFNVEAHSRETFFDEYLTLNLGVYTNGNKTGVGAYSFKTHLNSHKLDFWFKLDNETQVNSGWNLYYPYRNINLFPNQHLVTSTVVNGVNYSDLLLDSVNNGQVLKVLLDETNGVVLFQSNGPIKRLLKSNFIK